MLWSIITQAQTGSSDLHALRRVLVVLVIQLWESRLLCRSLAWALESFVLKSHFGGKLIEYFSGGEAVGAVHCETVPKDSQACTAFMKFVFDSFLNEKSIVINKFGACSCHIQGAVVLSGTSESNHPSARLRSS